MMTRRGEPTTARDERGVHDNPAMGPDWLGNPQHVVAGAVLAFVVAQVTRAWVRPWWGRATVAVGAATTAEIVVELVEYLLLYQDDATVREYYDTLSDLGSSLFGGVAGTALGLVLAPSRS
jgi:hypothetical protein